MNQTKQLPSYMRYDYTDIAILPAPGEDTEITPRPLTATKKLMRTIADARETHPTEEAFADWLMNYMEGYAALYAHPSFDASEGAEGTGPQCSFCGAAWAVCGHARMSQWEPTTNEDQQ